MLAFACNIVKDSFKLVVEFHIPIRYLLWNSLYGNWPRKCAAWLKGKWKIRWHSRTIHQSPSSWLFFIRFLWCMKLLSVYGLKFLLVYWLFLLLNCKSVFKILINGINLYKGSSDLQGLHMSRYEWNHYFVSRCVSRQLGQGNTSPVCDWSGDQFLVWLHILLPK